MIHPWSLHRASVLTYERERWSHWLTSARAAALSFGTLVVIGTVGLLVGPGFYTGDRLGLVDALFTATSAVCVTGLIVVDTATAFTPLGQAWIAALIQAGGLGILTFTTAFALALGGKSRLALEEAAGGEVPQPVLAGRRSLFKAILLVTLTIEAVGALALWLSWRGPMGNLGAVGPALFHAISAFCNAGFSTFSDSLESYRESPAILGTIMILIVMGGIGFVVLEDLRTRIGSKRRRPLTLHTKLALTVTGVLILLGWGLFTAFEWSGQLREMAVPHRLLNGLFMAVTPRTAGFNTVNYFSVDNPSMFLTMIFMVVGGSPGSTAGGLKTVSLGVLLLVLLARLRGDARVSAFGRTLPRETIQRSVGLFVGGLMLLALAVFLLLVLDASGSSLAAREHFITLLFEAASAFGTVGLSMGATPDLTVLGKVLIIALMYVGRLGPLILVASMTPREASVRRAFRYGEEDVMIG